MMHFSKILFMNPAEIRISGISCSFKNIAKIFTVFALKWTVVLIDSVTEESSLRVFVKDQGLEYFERSSSAGSVELSAVVPYPFFADFLDKAIQENPENIFVVNLLAPARGVLCSRRPFEELVKQGIADVSISILLDEYDVLISVNKSLIPPRELFKRLKALF